MFFSCKRPRDLVLHCLVVAGAFIIGSLLYAQIGEKFSHWIVVNKLPEIQKQMELEYKWKPIETSFSQIDLSNVNWSGAGQKSGGLRRGR